MTSRERVQLALNHQEPDRVPLDLGSVATSMLVDTYENLKTYLGLESKTQILSRLWQCVFVDEAILKHFDIDTRYVVEKGPKHFKDKELPGDAFIDEWGVKRKRVGIYYEITDSPLERAQIEDLEKYPWPNPLDPGRIEGLLEEAENLYRNTNYAIVGTFGGTIFEQAWYLRGYAQFLMDLVINKEFTHALLRKITDIQVQKMKKCFEKAGDYVDVVINGDDLGAQKAPAISPALYREMIKPYHKELFDVIHSLSKAKIFYHSCGNVYPLINDLIEAGIEILNPVQVFAEDMGDTTRLKKEFGERICFWGAIDTQKVMPFGSENEVRCEVKRRIHDLASGGGYVLAAVHNMPPDVSPENICAMFDAGKKYGQYPLRAR